MIHICLTTKPHLHPASTASTSWPILSSSPGASYMQHIQEHSAHLHPCIHCLHRLGQLVLKVRKDRAAQRQPREAAVHFGNLQPVGQLLRAAGAAGAAGGSSGSREAA